MFEQHHGNDERRAHGGSRVGSFSNHSVSTFAVALQRRDGRADPSWCGCELGGVPPRPQLKADLRPPSGMAFGLARESISLYCDLEIELGQWSTARQERHHL